MVNLHCFDVSGYGAQAGGYGVQAGPANGQKMKGNGMILRKNVFCLSLFISHLLNHTEQHHWSI